MRVTARRWSKIDRGYRGDGSDQPKTYENPDLDQHVKALGTGLLSNEVDSWMTGINRNVEGKQTRIVARYSGSAPAYRARCDEVAAKGYVELRLG